MFREKKVEKIERRSDGCFLVCSIISRNCSFFDGLASPQCVIMDFHADRISEQVFLTQKRAQSRTPNEVIVCKTNGRVDECSQADQRKNEEDTKIANTQESEIDELSRYAMLKYFEI